MKQKGVFIIGTDTDAGKTFVTAHLGGLWSESGYRVGMVKPVASGAITAEDGTLKSQDASEMMRLCAIPESRRAEVNPICLSGEYSPKLAAQLANITLPIDDLLCHVKDVVARHDITLVEGAGGITTPLLQDYSFADFAVATGLPAILVADGRLGSINRVLLTAAYAKQIGLPLKGIIVNDMEKTDDFLLKTNVEDMAYYTKLPILAVLPPYTGEPQREAQLAWVKSYLKAEDILSHLV